VCSLQSAGEAHSGPPGYQTDTRHSRAGLWETGGTGTGSCLRGTVPSHAETTEQLHTSPPGDKPTRLHSIMSNTAQKQISYSLHLHFLHLNVQVHKILEKKMGFNFHVLFMLMLKGKFLIASCAAIVKWTLFSATQLPESALWYPDVYFIISNLCFNCNSLPSAPVSSHNTNLNYYFFPTSSNTYDSTQ
jgi:hypothetical protein